jgi:hypothetical protein
MKKKEEQWVRTFSTNKNWNVGGGRRNLNQSRMFSVSGFLLAQVVVSLVPVSRRITRVTSSALTVVRRNN